MKLYIPDIGDKITLSKDWEFKLFKEYRNDKLLKAFSYNTGKSWWTEQNELEYHSVSLPKETVLVVDRIYIRKGSHMAGYSSVTFKIESCSDKTFNKARFWVKLEDCNTIEFETPTLAKRLDKIKFESEWHYIIRSNYDVQLSEKEYKNLLNLFPQNTEYSFKDGNIYVNGKKIELLPKLVNIFSYPATKSISDKNRKSNIKDKILTLTYKNTFVSITKPDRHSRITNMFGISSGEEFYTISLKTLYILKDGEILIGEYKTASTMLKHAKTYLENLKNDPAYASVSNFKELFS